LDEVGEDDEDEDMAFEDDVDLRIARLSKLMDRRPLLVNAVKLRQNPHNVHQWKQRIELMKEDPVETITCFTEAVQTIDPAKATGKPHSLWVDFAKFYEAHGSLENADSIFERGTKQSFRFVDDLAQVWCEWGEMYIRHDNPERALEIVQQGVREPPPRKRTHQDEAPLPPGANKGKGGIQGRLYKSKRLWSFYVDLEESLGTLTTTRAAYDRMMKIKVATTRTILNYADLLRENKYFEDSFKVYEKGLVMFSWPHLKDIWLAYLTNFVQRYKGKKLERARDLFEQALQGVPAEHAKPFYLLYAQLEEKHGLMRHAMGIYNRATSKVDEPSRYDIYILYLKKAEESYGVTYTRPIYERAIENLPDDQVKTMCIKFADVERKLGEIDRARAIYSHASQLCDPQTVLSFWKTWHDFEVQHGNEDTFREMLRVKRSVQARFSQANYMTANMLSDAPRVQTDAEALAKDAAKKAPAVSAAAAAGVKRKAVEGGARETELEALERQAKQVMREGSGTIGTAAGVVGGEDTGDVQLGGVVELAVPDAVFGGIKADDGALARFKKGAD